MGTTAAKSSSKANVAAAAPLAAAANSQLFSQTIANLSTLNSQLSQLGNLPASAAPIQQSASSLIAGDITSLTQIQSQVLQYCTAALPQLNSALSSLNSGDTAAASSLINSANQSASTLQNNISGLVSNVNTSKAQLAGLSAQAAGIQQDLNTQIVGLQSQAASANSEADKYSKEKYYFLALGPFGLAGLATAIALYETWNSKANNLNSQVNALNAQISVFQMFVTNLNQLVTDFNNGVDQISDIKNAVDFLSADISNVIQDLNGSNSQAALLYLNAAISEVQTLQSDAS